MLKMDQTSISYVLTPTKVERAEEGKVLKISQTYICHVLAPTQAERVDDGRKLLDMSKTCICNVHTILQAHRRGTYKLAHFGKGVVTDPNRNTHMLVPRTWAHTQLTWGVTTSRHRHHVAARPSQSKVLRKGHERKQHSREHVITHTQNRTWRCLIRWWWRRTAWPLPWWGRRRKRRKRHTVHEK